MLATSLASLWRSLGAPPFWQRYSAGSRGKQEAAQARLSAPRSSPKQRLSAFARRPGRTETIENVVTRRQRKINAHTKLRPSRAKSQLGRSSRRPHATMAAALLLAFVASLAGCHRAGSEYGPELRVAEAHVKPGSSPKRRPLPEPPLHGITLGLFSQDPTYSYQSLLEEIHGTGARWVSLCCNFYQEKVDSVEVGVPDRRTADWERILVTIRQAHALGLRVFLFPIVLLQSPGEDDWRGTIRPKDPDKWYASYERLMVRFAHVAEEEGVALLSVGSEFNSMQVDTERWKKLIARIRQSYGGALTYSVNWDSITAPAFFSELDFIGMTTYFSLTKKNDPTVEELTQRWIEIREDIATWQAHHGWKLIFTEVGFPSQDGANKDPWNYFISKTVDLQEQADCFEAFNRVWLKEPALSGLFFYNWFGPGGAQDTGYTPRGKPALDKIKRWFPAPVGEKK